MCRTLPSATSSASAPTVSSIGVPRSTRCWCYVKVDPVGAQPLEGAFDSGLQVRRAAVDGAGPATGVRDHAEVRGNDDLVAAAGDGPSDDLLVVEGS
jgi:hypothetical protein